MKPIHKWNSGYLATLCYKCSVIITTGHTDELMYYLLALITLNTLGKMKIKLEFEIEVEDGFWFNPDCQEETEWFMDILNDKENTFAILHSNDIGDTLGQSNNFKYEIIK